MVTLNCYDLAPRTWNSYSGKSFNDLKHLMNVPCYDNPLISQCDEIVYMTQTKIYRLPGRTEIVNNDQLNEIFYAYIGKLCSSDVYEVDFTQSDLIKLTQQLASELMNFFNVHPEILPIKRSDLDALLNFLMMISRYQLQNLTLETRCLNIAINLFNTIRHGRS